VAGRRDNAQMMASINQPVSKNLTQAENSITMFMQNVMDTQLKGNVWKYAA
jgi:hypothetical protein